MVIKSITGAVLCMLALTVNAVTIIPDGGIPELISDLEVQGVTYDGWFGWSITSQLTDPDQFPFVGNQSGAEDAALQIAQALTDGGYNKVVRAWLDYFFVPFEDPLAGSVQAYRGKYSSSNGGEWLVTLDTTHGPSPANSWVLLTPVPIPSAVWLFGSGLIGLIGVAKKKARV